MYILPGFADQGRGIIFRPEANFFLTCTLLSIGLFFLNRWPIITKSPYECLEALSWGKTRLRLPYWGNVMSHIVKCLIKNWSKTRLPHWGTEVRLECLIEVTKNDSLGTEARLKLKCLIIIEALLLMPHLGTVTRLDCLIEAMLFLTLLNASLSIEARQDCLI